MRKQNTGFSIIEVMIGLFVFALGLVSIFMMLSGSITMSNYSRNLIVASNLANEQVELYKNIRDSNYKKVKNWIQIDPSINHDWENIDLTGDYDARKFFKKDYFYKIENNYSDSATFPILVQVDDPLSDTGDDSFDLPDGIEEFQLCVDDIGRYTYDCSGTNKKTPYYRFLYLADAEHDGSTNPIDGAYRVTSKVIWTQGSKFETEISTIVTDWKKL